MRRIAVALLVSIIAFAGEPDIEKEVKPISLELVNCGPDAAAKILLREAKLRVEFAPQAAARRANVKLINVPTVSGMKTIAEHFGCQVRFLGKRRWRVAPAWQFAVLDKIELRRDTPLNVKKMPIEEFLETVRTETGVDITLDPRVDRESTVTLRASKISCRKVLDRLVKALRLAWELRYGVLYIAEREHFDRMPVLPPQLETPALRNLRMPVDSEGVALAEVAPQLEKLMSIPFIVPEGMKARTVTAHAKDVTLEQALALLLYPLGWTAEEKDGAVHMKELPPPG